MNYFLLIIGFILLIKCADIFVDGCSKLARYFKIPSLIVGLTIVAFGTSAPEASVSITSSLKNLNSISVGNVVGSNICNLLLVLGISSCFGKLTVDKKTIMKDYSYMIFSSLVLFIMTIFYFIRGSKIAVIGRTSGLILLGLIIFYVISLIVGIDSEKDKINEEFHFKYIFYIIIGLIGVIYGGKLVVDKASLIARSLHISNHLIGLTVVAIGTSLPELVTSSIASYRGEDDIAIGNVIGSNIFNSLLILGLAGSIRPISIDFTSFIDIVVMLGATLVVFILLLRKREIDYKKGIFLIGLYLIYLVYIINR